SMIRLFGITRRRHALRLPPLLRVLGVVPLVLAACTRTAGCPSEIVAIPDPLHSGIVWGGDSTRVRATLQRAVADCIPYTESAALSGDHATSRKAVQFPVTADIEFEVLDHEWLRTATRYWDLEANIIFEARTESGVVLASARGRFRLIRGGKTTSVSATITSVSPEVARRVRWIIARWEYGR